MRAERRRTKKLTVAFHFQTSGGPARWRCDECRRQGLEASRRCGIKRPETRAAGRAVWARGRLAIDECPRSYITAASMAWLEEYAAWERREVMEMPARDVDAMLALDRERAAASRNEANHGHD